MQTTKIQTIQPQPTQPERLPWATGKQPVARPMASNEQDLVPVRITPQGSRHVR